MKNILIICAAAAACLLASCAHNASMLGAGTAFRIGSGEVSLHYADGLFLTNVSRENVRFSAELDSTLGVTYDPTTGSYKGIKGITYEIGPQLGGYAQELGEKSPEALKSYFDALAAYYEYRAKQDGRLAAQQSAISDDKSTSATQAVAEVIKDAIDKHVSGDKDKDDAPVDDTEDDSCETCGDVSEDK